MWNNTVSGTTSTVVEAIVAATMSSAPIAVEQALDENRMHLDLDINLESKRVLSSSAGERGTLDLYARPRGENPTVR